MRAAAQRSHQSAVAFESDDYLAGAVLGEMFVHPPTCGIVAGEEGSLEDEQFLRGERFPSMFSECGGRSGFTTTGRGIQLHYLDSQDESPMQPWRLSLPKAMEPGLTSICLSDDQTLAFFGGKGNMRAKGHVGIQRKAFVTPRSAGEAPRATQAAVVVSNGSISTTGCHERRSGFTGCEFDGKLSAVVLDGTTLLLYARANLHEQGGARHVQVAVSADEGLTFAPWRLVEIDGYSAGN